MEKQECGLADNWMMMMKCYIDVPRIVAFDVARLSLLATVTA
jgi:hypothetical protein